jgi:hypothetical protein
MDESMKLVLGWTLVVAFVFITGATCGSLVGWVKFANKKQQQGLYSALILDVVVAVGGSVTGNLRLDPKQVSAELRSEGGVDAVSGVVNEALGGSSGAAPTLDKEQLARIVEHIAVVPGTQTARDQAELRGAISRLPAGRISTEKAGELRNLELLRRRRVTP